MTRSLSTTARKATLPTRCNVSRTSRTDPMPHCGRRPMTDSSGISSCFKICSTLRCKMVHVLVDRQFQLIVWRYFKPIPQSYRRNWPGRGWCRSSRATCRSKSVLSLLKTNSFRRMIRRRIRLRPTCTSSTSSSVSFHGGVVSEQVRPIESIRSHMRILCEIFLLYRIIAPFSLW